MRKKTSTTIFPRHIYSGDFAWCTSHLMCLLSVACGYLSLLSPLPPPSPLLWPPISIPTNLSLSKRFAYISALDFHEHILHHFTMYCVLLGENCDLEIPNSFMEFHCQLFGSIGVHVVTSLKTDADCRQHLAIAYMFAAIDFPCTTLGPRYNIFKTIDSSRRKQIEYRRTLDENILRCNPSQTTASIALLSNAGHRGRGLGYVNIINTRD